MVAYFSAKTGGIYLRPDNLWDIVDQAAIIVIVGVGQTLVIIAGGIDLSVGAVMAFTGTLAAVLMLKYHAPPLVAALAGTLAGGVVGFCNGFVSVKTRVHPFIITLGSMMVFRGLALYLTGAQDTDLLPSAFNALGTGALALPLGSKLEIILSPRILPVYILIIGVAASLMLTRTRVGRYCFAIGSNVQSARLSGIRVDYWYTLYFVIAGLLFGFGGVVQAAKIKIGSPNGSQNAELEAIAAAVIGGTSLAGGQGSILGTVLGALLMAALRVGLRMDGQQPHWQMFWLGVAIIVAVIYDRLSRRQSGR
jgi:ribose/xylose/arabinose/galactoside ABC-type transport system permease subunit